MNHKDKAIGLKSFNVKIDLHFTNKKKPGNRQAYSTTKKLLIGLRSVT